MMLKKVCAASVLLFLSMLVFSSTIIVKSTSNPSDDYPVLKATPSSLEGINVGEVFTITVTLSNLANKNLYGFDISFEWNTNALEYVSHETRIPVETISGGVLHQPVLEIMNEVSASDGVYSLAYASMLPAESFNDDGVVFTATFALRQQAENAFSFGHAILVDNSGNMIPLSGQAPEAPFPFQDSQPMSEYRKMAVEGWLRWWITIMRPRLSCNSYSNGWTRAHN
jgi:hypothetical protein